MPLPELSSKRVVCSRVMDADIELMEQALEEARACAAAEEVPVGAVIVREDRVLSTGYNGTPFGMPNCSEGGCVRSRSTIFGLSLLMLPKNSALPPMRRCLLPTSRSNSARKPAR